MSQFLFWFNSPEWTQVVQSLLHTLWQGAITAVVLTLVMRRTGNPVLRYAISLSALGAIVLGGIVTWAVINNSSKNPVPILNQSPVLRSPAAQGSSIPAISEENKRNFDTLAVSQVKQPARATAWIALVWFMGAVLMLLRASIKIAGAEKLRRSCEPLENPALTQLVSDVNGLIGITRRVRVVVSEKLTSPVVVGLFLPTLILPLSLVTTLTQEQIRFILLHELAHIRRGDYLANLFQVFTESLLFFNPSVWWISHQVRREREVCCDALASELSGAPAQYAQTLIKVAEQSLAPLAAPALGFGDKREPSTLSDRIYRLLVPGYRPSLRLTWRAMLLALALGGILLISSAVGTRVAVAAIVTPQERIERIEKKLAEYGQESSVKAENANIKEASVTGRARKPDGGSLPPDTSYFVYYKKGNTSGVGGVDRLDRDGAFHAKISGGTFCIGVDAEGFALKVLGPFDASTTNEFDLGEIVLDHGFDVSIKLSDANTGRAITNAALKTHFRLPIGMWLRREELQEVDSSGIAKVSSCINQSFFVNVNAPGYEIVEKRFENLKAGQRLDIKLNPGRILTGTITDQTSGKPIPDATVRMLYEKGPVTACAGSRFRNFRCNHA